MCSTEKKSLWKFNEKVFALLDLVLSHKSFHQQPHLVPQVVRVQYASFWCRADWQHTHKHQSAAGKRLRSSGCLSPEPGYPPPQWNGHLTHRDMKVQLKPAVMLLSNHFTILIHLCRNSNRYQACSRKRWALGSLWQCTPGWLSDGQWWSGSGVQTRWLAPCRFWKLPLWW